MSDNDKVNWAKVIEIQLGDPVDPPPGTRCERTIVTRADGWTVTTERGWTSTIDSDAIPFGLDIDEPQPGDPITVWSHGSEIVGYELRGEHLYLRSEREVNLRWLLFRASLHRERREEFARQKDELDAAYKALPDVLKARIDRFRGEDPDFRADSEAYEMAAVADAPKVARALRSGRKPGPDGYPTDLTEDEANRLITEFRDLPWEEQRKAVPDLNEGHSGNTFGAATMLAYRLLTGQEC